MASKLIQRLSYQYIGQMFESRLHNYEELRRKLRRGGIDISLRMYLSLAVFQAIVGTLVTWLVLGMLAILLPLIPFVFVFIFGILVGLVVYVIKMIWPDYLIGERKRKLEAGLPSAASYMAAMSSAGVTPDQIFFSLSSDEIGLTITDDAKKISRDIQIFGLDIIRAIENASLRSPSSKFSSFLEGINATNTSGGDLQGYFEATSAALMKDKLQDEKGFIELLGLYAELFLVACIVTPTFGIVLIAMVALQGTMDHDNMTLIVYGLTFILIPILQLMIIVLVDGSQPLE